MNKGLRAISVALCATMVMTAAGSQWLKPTHLVSEEHRLELDRVVPRSFGDWKATNNTPQRVVDAETQATLDRIYSQLLERTYVNSQGYAVMLVIAYGNEQRRSLTAHRPDVCYPAQGFSVDRSSPVLVRTDFGDISAEQMTARRPARVEPVTFWFTLGTSRVRNSIDRRLVALKYSLTGEIPDGMIFRVSSIDDNNTHGFGMQQAFLRDLTAALTPEGRARLEGLN